MVAVRTGEADRMITPVAPHFAICLVYGADAGLVSERVQKIVKQSVADPNDPFQCVRLEGDAVAADPARLWDEAGTIGLFGGRRLIRVTAGSKDLGPALEPLLATPPEDCRVVIEAGALRGDASLKRLCERDRNALAIACYPDDENSLRHLMTEDAAAAGLTIEPDAEAALLELLGADRLTTRGEIEKLLLYAHGTPAVTLADVEAAVADASALAVDAAIAAAFGGDLAALNDLAERVGGTAGVEGLLGAALRHALSLHSVRIAADAGQPLDRALEQVFRGPAPTARRAALQDQARRWTRVRLATAIETLGEAIGRARRDAALAEPIALRALWSVAQAARAR